MKNLIYIILLYSYVFPQETIGEGLYSDPLIDYLQDSYTTSNVQSYANARDILYSEIEISNGYVYGIYTNYNIWCSYGITKKS